MKYEATHLRENLWAVRPEGCLGTCGWVNGIGWTVAYVRAPNASAAIDKATDNR